MQLYEVSALCIDVLFVSTEPIHKILLCNYYGMWRFLDGVPPPKKTNADETIKEKKSI